MNYKYESEIESKLKVFEEYLKSERYALATIKQTRNYAGVYLVWLESKQLKVNQVGYEQLSTFIFQLKEDRSENLVRRIVLAVRHYYDSLELDKNPAWGIHIRGSKNSILNAVVDYKELLELYNSYPVLDDRLKRNKVILGLLIYQGISSGVLQRLELVHVKIDQGKIYMPGIGKTNSRTLVLDSNQLLDLQEYVQEIRPRMLSNIGAKRSGRKPDRIDPIIKERLFFSEGGNASIKQSVYHMFRAIKKVHPSISSGKIIRSTVIAEWLKTKDIRIVQYMAGHRWVSSTERYNVYNLQELKEVLKKHHPLASKEQVR